MHRLHPPISSKLCIRDTETVIRIIYFFLHSLHSAFLLSVKLNVSRYHSFSCCPLFSSQSFLHFEDNAAACFFCWADTMGDLEQWVNDRLHDILGLSDRYVAQFMIGTARRATSSQDFVSRLQQTGTIDIDQSVTAFAHELFDKVCRLLLKTWNVPSIMTPKHLNII